jgi:hypothetical protein
VEAAEEADRLGADIINTSLGYFDFDNAAYNHSYSQMNGNTTLFLEGQRSLLVRYSCSSICRKFGSGSNPYIAAPADAVSIIAEL